VHVTVTHEPWLLCFECGIYTTRFKRVNPLNEAKICITYDKNIALWYGALN